MKVIHQYLLFKINLINLQQFSNIFIGLQQEQNIVYLDNSQGMYF